MPRPWLLLLAAVAAAAQPLPAVMNVVFVPQAGGTQVRVVLANKTAVPGDVMASLRLESPGGTLLQSKGIPQSVVNGRSVYTAGVLPTSIPTSSQTVTALVNAESDTGARQLQLFSADLTGVAPIEALLWEASPPDGWRIQPVPRTWAVAGARWSARCGNLTLMDQPWANRPAFKAIPDECVAQVMMDASGRVRSEVFAVTLPASAKTSGARAGGGGGGLLLLACAVALTIICAAGW